MQSTPLIMLRWILVVLLFLHGTIHLIGFVKAFDLASVPQLPTPIGRAAGVAWLVAALAFVAGALMLALGSRLWWTAAAPALVASQLVIALSWADARWGTIPNLIALAPLAVALLDLRPGSLRSSYVDGASQAPRPERVEQRITEGDLAPLPPLVQTYLRRVGVVGEPRVHDVRARFHGRFRGKPDAAWMSFHSEQLNTYDPPSRLFFMEASLFGVPVDAFHRYVGPSATFQVRVASLFELVDARGPEMNRSETVTLFNDLCILAPAALPFAGVTWEAVDARSVRATFTHAGNTISAVLSFDEAGDLVGFLSHDRSQSADGKTYRQLPWSTPLRNYQRFGHLRLAQHGDAIWLAPEGDLTYGEFDLDTVEYNVAAR
jgi:uncharacterized membrane protein YphA (DoxX/SURF4 family)